LNSELDTLFCPPMSPLVDDSAAAVSIAWTPGSTVPSTADNVSTAGKEERGLRWSALGLTAIIVATTGGNLLVCLAVCLERRLQNITNYFLMSLAIADLLVSVLVMPLAMIVELFGEFRSHPFYTPPLVNVAANAMAISFCLSVRSFVCRL